MLPRRAALIGLVLLLLAVACGGPSTRLVTVRSPTGSGAIDFTVKNLSSAGINTFHLAKTEKVNQTGKEHVDPNTPEGAALWGPDLLGAAIGSGQSQPVKVPEPGNWDARAVDRDGREQLITRLHLGAGGRYILELYDGGWRVYSD